MRARGPGRARPRSRIRRRRRGRSRARSPTSGADTVTIARRPAGPAPRAWRSVRIRTTSSSAAARRSRSGPTPAPRCTCASAPTARRAPGILTPTSPRSWRTREDEQRDAAEDPRRGRRALPAPRRRRARERSRDPRRGLCARSAKSARRGLRPRSLAAVPAPPRPLATPACSCSGGSSPRATRTSSPSRASRRTGPATLLLFEPGTGRPSRAGRRHLDRKVDALLAHRSQWRSTMAIDGPTRTQAAARGLRGGAARSRPRPPACAPGCAPPKPSPASTQPLDQSRSPKHRHVVSQRGIPRCAERIKRARILDPGPSTLPCSGSAPLLGGALARRALDARLAGAFFTALRFVALRRFFAGAFLAAFFAALRLRSALRLAGAFLAAFAWWPSSLPCAWREPSWLPCASWPEPSWLPCAWSPSSLPASWRVPS